MNLSAIIVLCHVALFAETRPESTQSVIVVVGAPGTPEYGEEFERWAAEWKQAAADGGAEFTKIGPPLQPEPKSRSDREHLVQVLSAETKASLEPLWLVLIGHGTFDGRLAKFNLRGPDVSAAELADLLGPFERPLAVVNCASASGPFINRLSRESRVVVTATQSGYEQNYARFGSHLAKTMRQGTDIDKDGQVSLLEAFLEASVLTAAFYDKEARLATEHALIDDNGDELGTPGQWFRGIRAVGRPKSGAAPDGQRANQFVLVRSAADRQLPAELRQRRDELELAMADLREQKAELEPDTYYARLEPIALELARLYESLEKPEGDKPADKTSP